MTSDGIFYYFSTANPEKRVPLLSKVFGKNLEIEEISISEFINLFQSILDMNEKNEEWICKEFNEEDNIYYLYVMKK